MRIFFSILSLHTLELRLVDTAMSLKTNTGNLVMPDFKKSIKVSLYGEPRLSINLFHYSQPALQAIKKEIIAKGRKAGDDNFEMIDELESSEELLKEAEV